jgi:diaminopimelate decarboxylase
MPKIICEPGRALVAESGSTVVRVNLRKNKNFILMMELTERYLMLVHQILFILQK